MHEGTFSARSPSAAPDVPISVVAAPVLPASQPDAPASRALPLEPEVLLPGALQWTPEAPASSPNWASDAQSSNFKAAADDLEWQAEFEAALRADEVERALAEDKPGDRDVKFYGRRGKLELLGSGTITCAGTLCIAGGTLCMESGACIDLSGGGVLDLDESALDLTGELVGVPALADLGESENGNSAGRARAA